MRDLPKVELHLHLEGAMPPALTRALAKEKNIDLHGIFDQAGGYAFDDFWHFLKVYEAATGVLQGPEDYRRLTLAVLEESAAHGVVYSETFVSPDYCGGGDLAAWRDYVAAMEDAARAAEASFGITLRGIVTCIRHLDPEASKAVARCAAETQGSFITGFGMAGDEKMAHPQDFAWAFDCAREAGLGITCHAGEWGGPDSVRAALEVAKPSRIGHGVRAIEDAALIYRLAELGTVLEVCPGSNVALGLYPGWKAHPIAQLLEKGLRVTVSTDDPPFFHTTMTSEYENLSKAFGWGPDTFAALNKTALEAAFCDAKTKAKIAKKLDQE